MSYLPLLGRFLGIRASFRENTGWLGEGGGDGKCDLLVFVRGAFLRCSVKGAFRFGSLSCVCKY